jgi:hypothetical protein
VWRTPLASLPSEAKASLIFADFMYGLKPVPFKHGGSIR